MSNLDRAGFFDKPRRSHRRHGRRTYMTPRILFATDLKLARRIAEVVSSLQLCTALHYSTIKAPFILLCPKPQNCEHWNGKVPALSATNSTVTGSPFGSF
jgi:hypothetical protein